MQTKATELAVGDVVFYNGMKMTIQKISKGRCAIDITLVNTLAKLTSYVTVDYDEEFEEVL
ncbi:hypothetical protein RVBP17_0070 [Pseudomonas phage sp. 30-3]|uniref:Uncharacterized protein n=1 Tax=Pseudomonas phage vB_PaeM_PA5oct TaxID=2163605 RepID=A0A4Y5JU92_9CAUD|nr:hypothetical protein PQE65_gp390 [Pseudomonas phage vB_PaeM_PA5oct]WMI32049.1 hypothetical protein GBBBJNDB_00358 [Pseudomonas phage Callisto]WPK39069.1 hypothetical protein Cassandra_0393 [Pseudomonas phage Cassandra]WPK39580.1 hypothetical protein Deiofobo_0383 [Pseudomonas phage Deifobo]WPK40100.1 hypothetical protein ETTORE_0391 [Pseudomonas phage Ettore]WPK40613.1 hypothetical protein Paride_0383 [Pseudomonas phage Paride]VOH55849.1 hypothetical protein MIJ3_00355 [Pseudomonas phage v